jgi:tetratricopeptide (TPR) repeat protein
MKNALTQEAYNFKAHTLLVAEDVKINREILTADPDNAYASKGLGLALYRMGQITEGLEHMYNAINMKHGVNAETYYDLYAVLLTLKREDEALQVRGQAQKCDNYPDWLEQFNAASAVISDANTA